MIKYSDKAPLWRERACFALQFQRDRVRLGKEDVAKAGKAWMQEQEELVKPHDTQENKTATASYKTSEPSLGLHSSAKAPLPKGSVTFSRRATSWGT